MMGMSLVFIVFDNFRTDLNVRLGGGDAGGCEDLYKMPCKQNTGDSPHWYILLIWSLSKKPKNNNTSDVCVYRAEDGPTCIIIQPVDGDKKKSRVTWLLNMDVKVNIYWLHFPFCVQNRKDILRSRCAKFIYHNPNVCN